jgi:CHASE3 domain sensor protein
MTPVAPEDRRRRNADVQAAHLEGRMDMIEQHLEMMDKKIDGVVFSIDKVLQEIKATSDRMQRMDIEATERDGRVRLLEQRIGDLLSRPAPATTQTTTTTTSPTPPPEDELVRYRKRAVDVFVISICVLGIFGVVIFISNNMLNKQTAETAGKIIEHVP